MIAFLALSHLAATMFTTHARWQKPISRLLRGSENGSNLFFADVWYRLSQGQECEISDEERLRCSTTAGISAGIRGMPTVGEGGTPEKRRG
jgi:hypothetical protein